jgi:alpha-L-fucosidase
VQRKRNALVVKKSAAIRTLILAAVLAIAGSRSARAADDTNASWLPGETVAQRDARTAWFRQAKFGMFIHWGLYSIPAKGEWYMRSASIPFAEYAKYATQFNPVNFDAERWTGLAHDAGMKYMVLTTKHHDGFALFKSHVSTYNVVDGTPFGRDVVKELADACPKHGVRFGAYYSFLSDWGHKGGGAGGPHWDPAAQDGDLHSYIHDVALPQVKELLTNYGPLSVMWFDSDGAQGMTTAESAEVVKMLAAQPQIVVDPRLPGVKGDFGSSEVYAPLFAPEGPWELCSSVTASWGFANHTAKPLTVLLPYIIDAWGKGGNMLLNVGPKGDGTIPEDNIARLHEIGAWLRTYGSSIYGSVAGPFDYLPWGTATRKGNTVYLQIFHWPEDGHLRVPLLNRVKKAVLLGPGGPQRLTTSQDGSNRLIVNLPGAVPDPIANVVALTLEGDPKTDYRSVVMDLPVNASAAQKSAALVVDRNVRSRWESPETTGWLEFTLAQPATVGTLRISPAYCKVSDFNLEYKEGENWKPILTGEKAPDTTVTMDFPPVTARVFRLNILSSDAPIKIGDIGLYPRL